MPRRIPFLAIATLTLLARLAFAEPQVRVEYRAGAAVVRLEGDWSGSTYSIARSESQQGPFATITESSVLCLGDCSVADDRVTAGRTYWYRFDLRLEDGRFVTFGPYPVTISSEIARRVTVALAPTPVRGPARVAISLAGRPGDPQVEVRALLFDLQGRRLRVLHQGSLPRGTTSLQWDGRGADGRPLEAGVYLLRVESPLGSAVARVVRER